MYVEYPHIHGTAEEKIEQISNYLFKLAEVSNYNLDQSTPEGIFRQAAEAVTSAESEAIEKGQRAKFGSLRDLIIKSAGSVMISQEEISHSLAGLFVATSDFGTFKKETEQNFSANSESFKSLFKKNEEISTDLTNYKTEMQNYIFAGYDGDTFALDVGLLKDTYTEDGKTTENGTPKKIRITPSRLSLFSGDYEAAYLSENAIYFPNANITGGTLNIGSGRFTVDSKGALSATGAKISGDITATSGSFSGELKAATGSFSGSITATGGTIAGWKIGTGAPGLPTGATAIYNEITGEDGIKYSIGMQSNFSSTGNINFFVKSQKNSSSDWEDIFYVKNNGKLKATNAEIEGTISASTISASSITNGTYGASSTGFSLTSDGHLYASGATIYGAIHATSGSFSGELKAATGTFSGSLSAAKGTFSGELKAATGTFSGSLSAAKGTFAGSLSAAGGTFNGDISAATGTFTGEIKATSGSIGNWNIGTGNLYSQITSTGGVSSATSAVQGIYANNTTYEIGMKADFGNAANLNYYVYKSKKCVFGIGNNGTMLAQYITVGPQGENNVTINGTTDNANINCKGKIACDDFEVTTDGNVTMGAGNFPCGDYTDKEGFFLCNSDKDFIAGFILGGAAGSGSPCFIMQKKVSGTWKTVFSINCNGYIHHTGQDNYWANNA